jgi:mannose-1-phosphate guanylyltransferase/mannose-6-phosphate isomerase
MMNLAEQSPPAVGVPIRPVILCGGNGARLWPLSRANFPKQLVDFHGGPSLLQNTVRRVTAPLFSRPVLVSGEEHRFTVRDQAAETGSDPECVILEKQGRNTGPAIAFAAQWLARDGGDELLLVLPSDHVIDDPGGLIAAVELARPAAEAGKLVLFGTAASSPDPGFGQVRVGQRQEDTPVLEVVEFVPAGSSGAIAAVEPTGDCLWNAGIFLFRASSLLDELAKRAPALAAWARAAIAEGTADGTFFRPREENGHPPGLAESIEQALLEKSPAVVAVAAEMGLSDLGSWNAVRATSPADPDGNAVQGNAFALDTRNSLVYSYGDATVATVGVENLIVVATKDAVLVAPTDRAEDVRKVVDELKQRGDMSGEMPSVIHRPWGTYQTTDRDERFQTKRIVVKPGAKLSSQLHHHRSEHWVVVSGTAEVTVGEKTFLLHENQSTYISAGTVHRLANPGRVPLHLVEVQCGTYLGEDDIVRFEDVYGRTDDQPQS